MASDNNTDQGHSHGLQCQHMPQTSAWSPVEIQTKIDVSWLGCRCARTQFFSLRG